MIKFKSIRIEGFNSILEPLSYMLGQKGVNIISGSNGAGKSTIFSALSWCLYGKALKETSEITPWKENNGTRVDVFLEHPMFGDIIITRTHKYKANIQDNKPGGSRILIVVAGEIKENLRDKTQIQEYITNLLGISHKLFKHSIVFGQKLTRLLQESGPKQKEIFDEAFTVNYINLARQRAQIDQQKMQKDYNEWLEKTRNKLKVIDHIKDKKAIYEKKEKEIREEINEIEKERYTLEAKKADKERTSKNGKGIEAKIASLESYIEAYQEDEKLEFKIDLRRGQLEAFIQGLKDELRGLTLDKAKLNLMCPKCGKPMDDPKALKEAQAKRREIIKLDIHNQSKRLATMKKSHAKVKGRLIGLDEKKKILSALRSRLSFRKSADHLIQEYKATILKKSVELKKQKIRLKETLKELKSLDFSMKKQLAQLEILNPRLKRAEENLKMYNWLIQDPLSNKGLKAFIFDSRLSLINRRLEHYAQYLGHQVEFGIDLDSGNKNFYAIIDGSKEYEALSGGEKQLVDIALAFAVHDVAVDKRLNLLAMDELFESLDTDNIEKVSDLLSIKAQGIALHIITHQKTLQVSNTVQIALVKKHRKRGTLLI